MKMKPTRLLRARALGAPALAALASLWVVPAAHALSISPLNGTPDASPASQISFLGVPPAAIHQVFAVGSRSGRHPGRLLPYATAAGASFLPRRPFLEGERVTAGANIVIRGRSRRVTSTFTVARFPGYRASFGGPSKPPASLLQSFVSAPGLRPPKILVTASSPAASAGDVFITPTHGLGQSGPMIIDGHGQLVWYHPLPSGSVATNLQVQSYHGQPVLTWWQGHIAEKLGVGFGRDEIYSPAYTRIASVNAGNGYQADLHDFQLTPRGSALLTAYTLVDADLSRYGGPRDGILQDALMEEVDVPTGLVMFEWHAYGHVDPGDSFARVTSSSPWDYFHLNSISEDPWGDGNFIISSRNTWAAYEINHSSGDVDWRLGGKRSSFKMGPGTGTAWQHDVRWQGDRTLTIFDNGAVPRAHSLSRVIRERIDFRHRTVHLIGRYVRVPGLLTGSQGNDQLLPDGNSFVGWGELPYFTEFDSAGNIVFDAHIPSPGNSYRAYRFPWAAAPSYPPAIAVHASGAATTVYASWNGATQVAAWVLLGGDSPSALQPLVRVPPSGFETAIASPQPSRYFAVQALDAAGAVLSTSAAAAR